MELWELFVLAVALSMDAFAVSVCKGLATRSNYVKTGVVCGVWFGFFQALMPLLGYLLATVVTGWIDPVYVDRYSSVVAFALLAFLGVKMIVESVKEDEECACNEQDTSLSFFTMFTFALATSIDALAAGVSYAAMDVNIWSAILFIGVTTAICSFIGAVIGAKIGGKYKNKAEIAGGIILILMGLKILIEYLITIF